MKSKRIILISLLFIIATISIGAIAATDSQEINEVISTNSDAIDDIIAITNDNSINTGASPDTINIDNSDNSLKSNLDSTSDMLKDDESEDNSSENDITSPKTIIVNGTYKHQVLDNPSIQNAINEANPGDTILLTGKEYLHGHIIINKTLTIRSEVGTNITTCPHYTTVSGIPGIFYITPEGSGSVIEGITLYGTDDAEYYYGIYLAGASNVTINNCKIVQNEKGEAIVLKNATNTTLTNLKLESSNNDIVISDSNDTAITNSTIIEAQTNGILIEGSSTNTTIKNNNISDNTVNGISLKSLSNVVILNNLIENNGNTDETGIIINNNANITLKTNYNQAKFVFSNMTTTAIYTARTGEYFVANLTDEEGNALANKTVQIGFNGASYTRTTDENGSFRLQVNLKIAGGYTFAICFLGDNDYNSSFAVAKITVKKATTKLTNVKSKYTYKTSATSKSIAATLKLSNGTVISKKTVTFTVNGKTYSATTNTKGIATVKVSITAKKTYKYTVKFAETTQLAAASTTGTLVIN